MRAVLCLLLAFLLGVQSTRAVNVTPSGNTAFAWANNVDNFGGDVDLFLPDVEGQGYTTTNHIYQQSHGMRNPPLTLPKFVSEVGGKRAILLFAVDGGDGSGLCVELNDTTQAGFDEAVSRMSTYIGNQTVTSNDVYVSFTDDGWGIFLRTSLYGVGMSIKFKSCSPVGSIVYANACLTGTLSGATLKISYIDNGASVAIGNPTYIESGDVTTEGTALYNAYHLWSRLGGGEGTNKRSAAAAVDGLTVSYGGQSKALVTNGNGNIVLAPTAWTEYELFEDGTVLGMVHFDAVMNQSDCDFVLATSGDLTCAVTDCFWQDDHTLRLNYTACNGCGCLLLVQSAKSVGNHNLDGDGVTPNGDPLEDEVDPNKAVAFGRRGAFPEQGGVTVFWVSRHPDSGTEFRVFGNSPVRLLATAPTAATSSPYLHRAWMQTDATSFEVLGVSTQNPSGVSSRSFRLASQPPEDWNALLALNDRDTIGVDVPPGDDDDRDPPPPDTSVTNLVFVGPANLMSASDSIIVWNGDRGITSQKIFLTSGSISVVKNAVRPIWQKWVNLGSKPEDEPFVVFVGNRGIVQPWLWPDSTGECQSDSCLSYSELLDFSGDDEPELLWTTVYAADLAEAQRERASALWWCHNRYETGAGQRAFLADGNLAGLWCEYLSHTTSATVDSVAAVYREHGVETILRRDSEYGDCEDYAARQRDGYAVVNSGITEYIGHGVSDYDWSPAMHFQRVYEPLFAVDSLTTRQAIVMTVASCGWANFTTEPENAVALQLLNGDVTQTTTAATVMGAMRGGRELHEEGLLEKFVIRRFDPSSRYIQRAFGLALRDAWRDMPSAHEYLRTVGSFGFPIPMPGMPVTGIGDHPAAARTGLLFAGPVPSRAGVSILYRLAEPAFVDMRIYDATGRVIAVPVLPSSTLRQPGVTTVQWDGRDALGRTAPSGVYFARLRIGTSVQTVRLVLTQ